MLFLLGIIYEKTIEGKKDDKIFNPTESFNKIMLIFFLASKIKFLISYWNHDDIP